MTVRANLAAKKWMETLNLYLAINKRQIDGIVQALAEAENPDAIFIDHAEVLAKWEAKKVAH